MSTDSSLTTAFAPDTFSLMEDIVVEISDINLADQLFERLKEAIIEGQYVPGSKLSEPQLARQFGTSRGPLREAIRRLQERRLVTRSPNQGARVALASIEGLSELYVLREALEGMAARQAAQRATDSDIETMNGMLQTHAAALQTTESTAYWQDANTDFHACIARIGRNQLLVDLLCGEYYALMRFYRMQHRLVTGRAQRALTEHFRIAEAIANRDPDLSEMLMRRHISSARKAFENEFRDAGLSEREPAVTT